MMTEETKLEMLPEASPRPDMRLGRHHFLDARSLNFTVSKRHPRRKVVPVRHPCPTDFPLLDQGNLGSCTGNASTAALAAGYGDQWKNLVLDGKKAVQDPEAFAVETYHDETLIDGLGAPYPDNDRGSLGIAACKVFKAAGLIAGYTWATTVDEFAQMLQLAGVIIGTPWYNSFFRPGPGGYIDDDPQWLASGIAGGHELYVEALESWDPTHPANTVLLIRNSWGPNWGVGGYCRMRMSTYIRLRSQIDLKQFQISQMPEPVPTPGNMTSAEYQDLLTRQGVMTEAFKLINQGKMQGASGLAGKIVELQGGQPLDYNPIADYS